MKQVESIKLIREQRERRQQQLAFHARPFVLCGLHLRCPPSDQTLYSKSIGWFFLQVLAHPQFGLPFGQDRLIPIWVATLAVRQRSRIVRFRRASEMLDFFRLFTEGKRYRRVMEGFQRIFAAIIFFGCNDEPEGKLILDWARFHFFDRLQLWFHKDQAASLSEPSDEIIFVLSEAFYEEIDAHRIPVNLNVLRALTDSPGNLDLYVWLVWRFWTAKGLATGPLFGPEGLISQLGISESLRERDFRRQIVQWLKVIHQLWPGCPASLAESGACLLVKPAKSSPKFPTGRREFESGVHAISKTG